MHLTVLPLSASTRDDFFVVHSDDNGAGWCFCIAWWLPDWDGWGERSADENRAMRESMLDSGLFDGFILYADNQPVGWCQCAPRDQFSKLCRNYKLEQNPDIWAITCMFIIPSFRKHGLAHSFLDLILKELKKQQVLRVQAFPRSGDELPDGDIWTGPETVFQRAGFTIERDHPAFPIYSLDLTAE